MLPAVGCKMPAISFSSVLFPDPFSPTMQNVSPFLMSSVMSRTAQCSRYSRRRPKVIASFSRSPECWYSLYILETPSTPIMLTPDHANDGSAIMWLWSPTVMTACDSRRAWLSVPRALAAALLLLSGLHAATARDYRAKVGVYVWGKVGGGLDAAADDVKRLGADRVVRVYIGPDAPWDPAGKSDD